jgi:hypothetical protein
MRGALVPDVKLLQDTNVVVSYIIYRVLNVFFKGGYGIGGTFRSLYREFSYFVIQIKCWTGDKRVLQAATEVGQNGRKPTSLDRGTDVLGEFAEHEQRLYYVQLDEAAKKSQRSRVINLSSTQLACEIV